MKPGGWSTPAYLNLTCAPFASVAVIVATLSPRERLFGEHTSCAAANADIEINSVTSSVKPGILMMCSLVARDREYDWRYLLAGCYKQRNRSRGTHAQRERLCCHSRGRTLGVQTG